MRIKKCLLLLAVAFAAVLAVIPAAYGQSITLLSSPVDPYNRILVADLGFTGGGGRERIFQVQFGGPGAGLYHLHIEVIRSSDLRTLLEGNTDDADYATVLANGPSYFNYQLNNAFGGGSFSISDDAKKLKDQVLATGALPQGIYTIEIGLVSSVGVEILPVVSFPVTIEPPYLQPVYPVDVSTTRDTLAFRWVSNIRDRELHLFTDPRGNNEVLSGGRLPARDLGDNATSLPGAGVAPVLENGQTYFWQVWGKITTSHGDERVKSALSQFVYFEELGSVLYLGLSDADKNTIKDELIAILAEMVNKRAAKSIKEYEIDRIVLDNGVVTRDEILAILAAIKEKQVKVNSIYFR